MERAKANRIHRAAVKTLRSCREGKENEATFRLWKEGGDSKRNWKVGEKRTANSGL